MMFRNQTEVLDQYPKYFETSKLRQPAKKGQVYFGRFFLVKCKRPDSATTEPGLGR